MNLTLPGLDLASLRHYLDENHPGMVQGELTGELIQGGRSNLTYLLKDAVSQWVLRRPPLGHVLATAHDMSREYRVMTALAHTPVPVPDTYLMCPDDNVIEAPFFMMEYVPGTVYRSPEQTAMLTVEQREKLSLRLVDVLADLHSLSPDSVGLSDFGRPDGFLQRQLRRWSKQLQSSYSRDIEGIADLALRLSDRLPTSGSSGIVHGDYRMDNVVVGDDLSIDAVLDWEMATLGDPLTDLGLLVVYWEGLDGIANNPITRGIGPAYGFPSTDAILNRYADRSGSDLSTLDWYIAFGFFKIAVILEGIHYRFMKDQTVGDGFEHVGSLVQPLVAQGLSRLTKA